MIIAHVSLILFIGAIVKKYKNMDISESELKERCEEEMKSVYSREADQWAVVCT